jgi:UDP-glucose 4-epimerase
MRVLLTGATGFIGSHLLARLVQAPELTVAVVVRTQRAPWRIANLLDRVQRIEGDLARPRELGESVRRFAPDTVLHLAWGGISKKNRNDLQQIDNVTNTVELIKLAHASGARHFIGFGSQAEYGPWPSRIDEQQLPLPTTLYGTTKLCAGLLAGRMCAELALRFAWLRVFSVYGPKDDPTCLIPLLCRKLLAGERPAMTAGDQLWDFLYVEDAAEAIVSVASTPQATGVFNLGSGRVQPVREVAELLRDLIHPQAELGFGEVPYHPDQVMHLEANIDRLRQATGWEPRTELGAGLAHTVEWYRQHGEQACQDAIER